MRVAFILDEQQEENYAKKHLDGHQVDFYAFGTPVADVAAETEVLCVFIHTEISGEILAGFPQLKHIATRSTGFDHIDLGYCKRHGISVSNVPSYGERTVAEYAFALLLSLTRKVREGSERLQKAHSSDLDNLRGVDLFGKTLGIVGTGKIGRNAGHIGNGFGMNLLAYDVYPNQQWAQELGVTYVSLEDVYRRADVLTFHAPYNNETHHLMAVKHLDMLKKGVLVVNTARGALIETAALIQGLESGLIAGAALDVYEHEEIITKQVSELSPELLVLRKELDALLANSRVVMTAHNAFNTHEAIERILATTCANIVGFANGRPQNLII